MPARGGTRVRALVPPYVSRAVVLAILCVVVSAGALDVVAADAQMSSPPSEDKQPPKPRTSAANPVSGNPEAIAAGRKLYSMWCIQCHGPKADGVSRFGKYAADLREFWRGYREFVTIVKNGRDRKSTRLNSSHGYISYAVFCLKKKKNNDPPT